MKWLLRNWPYATLFAAGFLLALFPFFWIWSLPLALVFLQLPLYMLHQFEEHAHDRFRLFVNQHIGGGREVLTPGATFVINSIGVWGVGLVSLYLAAFVNPALGLIVIYLVLVNAVAHLGMVLAMRCYNPGLLTAVILFLPGGIWALKVVSQTAQANWKMQALGLGVALLIHLFIVVHVRRRRTRLN